jgi:hypothetical protein
MGRTSHRPLQCGTVNRRTHFGLWWVSLRRKAQPRHPPSGTTTGPWQLFGCARCRRFPSAQGEAQWLFPGAQGGAAPALAVMVLPFTLNAPVGEQVPAGGQALACYIAARLGDDHTSCRLSWRHSSNVNK